MSHKFLFYFEALSSLESTVHLSGDEHHHLNRVLRIDSGEEVFVTNGRGLMVKCTVAEKNSDSTQLKVAGPVDIPEHPRKITLALACIKKDRFEIALAQCTELGIHRCIPFSSERSSIRGFSPQYVDRLKKITIASIKQSFQATLPIIEPVMEFSKLVASLQKADEVVVGSLDAPSLDSGSVGDRLTLVVGPEAGFTDEELDTLTALDSLFASVSPHRLRSETAATALVSVLQRPFTFPNPFDIHRFSP